MSTNRDEAARLYEDNKDRSNELERAKCLLMFEISDSLTEIVKELRFMNQKN